MCQIDRPDRAQRSIEDGSSGTGLVAAVRQTHVRYYGSGATLGRRVLVDLRQCSRPSAVRNRGPCATHQAEEMTRTSPAIGRFSRETLSLRLLLITTR